MFLRPILQTLPRHTATKVQLTDRISPCAFEGLVRLVHRRSSSTPPCGAQSGALSVIAPPKYNPDVIQQDITLLHIGHEKLATNK